MSPVSPLTYEASETEVLRRNVPLRPELCSGRSHILNPPLTSLVTKYVSYPRLVLNTTDVVFVFFLVSLLFPFIIKYYFLISPNHQMHKTSFFFSSSNRIKYKHMCILVVVSRIWTYKSKACQQMQNLIPTAIVPQQSSHDQWMGEEISSLSFRGTRLVSSLRAFQ